MRAKTNQFPPTSDAGVETIPPDDAGITCSHFFWANSLTNGSWLTGVTASTYGHDPFLVTASEAEGHFQMEVNAGGLFFLRTSWAGYRTTFSNRDSECFRIAKPSHGEQ